MKIQYERWAVQRLRARHACSVEPGMSCVPLREDPICRACYDMSTMTDADIAKHITASKKQASPAPRRAA